MSASLSMGAYYKGQLSPQAREVVKAIQRFGSLSNVEAHTILKVRSLSRRITEIDKKTPINITKEWRKDYEGQRYVRYSIKPAELATLQRIMPQLFN